MPVSNKKKLAGKIIYNNGSLQNLEEEVEAWLEQIC
jgi:dephospho-CoA kinase